MNGLSLKAIAAALRGDVSGAQVLAPGPGHNPRDRSLAVKIAASSPDGFLVHSFAGDDFKDCRDYVAGRLGLRRDNPKQRGAAYVETSRRREVVPDEARRIERAKFLFLEGVGPRGTLVDIYLNGRGLEPTDDVAGSVIRFHPRCPWRNPETQATIFVPAMICAMRSIDGDAITAIHRTRLTADGKKVDRRMLGVASGAAIKLDRDDTVTGGLHIAEGVETAMAARQLGLRPTWALGSTSFISAFQVLPGIECLTILAENDEASAKAVETCAARWHAAGRVVLINRPARGKDLNDAIRGAA